MVNGAKTYVGQSSGASTQTKALLATRSVGRVDLPTDGLPTGRVGLYTNKAGVTFDQFRVYDASRSVDTAGRWVNFSGGVSSGASTVNSIDGAVGRLKLGRDDAGSSPVLLGGTRVTRFRATFSVRRSSSAADEVGFVFNARGPDDYDEVRLKHATTADAPRAFKYDAGAAETAVTATRTPANMPAASLTDAVWARIVNDGTTVTVKCRVSATEPTEGDWAAVSTCFSSANYDNAGGMIGFQERFNVTWIDDFKLEADRDGNGSYETLEHVDSFGVDGSGYADQALTVERLGI